MQNDLIYEIEFITWTNIYVHGIAVVFRLGNREIVLLYLEFIFNLDFELGGTMAKMFALKYSFNVLFVLKPATFGEECTVQGH